MQMEKPVEKKKRNYKVTTVKIIWILFALLSVAVWLPKADSLITSNYEQASEHVDLNSLWNVTVHGHEYKNVSLSEFTFPTVNKGDQVILQGTLPKELPFRDGVLRMNIKHSAVRIRIDGDVVYEYGFDRIAKNKSVGSGTQFIDFPDTYAGKEIQIEFYVDENQAFTYLEEINVYHWRYATQILLTENRLPMLLGVFLLIFGLVAILITMFIVVLSPKYIRLFLISAFSVCMGIWTLCYYDVMTVFTIPLYSSALMEYMALFLAPIFILGYMYDLVKRLENKWWTLSYWVLFVIQILFVSTAITLHTIDKVHCAATLPILLSLIVVELLFVFVVLFLNIQKSAKAKLQIKLYFIGGLILVIGTGCDIISYSSVRYLGHRIFSTKGISSLAIIFFVVDLIYIFFLDLTENIMKEKERDLLIQSAYSDELTKLHNRRYCSEYMKEAEKNGLNNVAVVCFDVNNLKTVNDTYGHAKGDVLIQASANIIRDTFQNHGIVGRMGGDEFIAIININKKEEIGSLLEAFEQNIRENNYSTKDFPVSIALGYALGMDENAANTEKLYQIADKRMYQNKKEMKSHEA